MKSLVCAIAAHPPIGCELNQLCLLMTAPMFVQNNICHVLRPMVPTLPTIAPHLESTRKRVGQETRKHSSTFAHNFYDCFN
jgi:hypothetical protein